MSTRRLVNDMLVALFPEAGYTSFLSTTNLPVICTLFALLSDTASGAPHRQDRDPGQSSTVGDLLPRDSLAGMLEGGALGAKIWRTHFLIR
jgi:hypothetical protein